MNFFSQQFIKKHYSELIILILILSIATFLRFYKLEEYMIFLGDQGRDAIEVKQILTEGDFPLLGPPTSVGNMYLGPLYYYMMAVPMAIFWLNPVAASGMVAMIGVLSVFLIYYLARVWFGKIEAITAAVLYALSPVAINYSRFSWNPNPAPFFTLLSIIGLYKVHQTKDYRWFILSAISLAFLIQMHYLGLIFVLVVVLLWLNELRIYLTNKDRKKYFFFSTFGAMAAFLFLMSPLVIFDFKYDFLNYRSITTFFTSSGTSVDLNFFTNMGKIIPIYSYNLIGRYLAGQNQIVSWILAVLVMLPISISTLMYLKRRVVYWPFLVLSLWLFIGIAGLLLYKQEIYDHYIAFLSPAPYLLLGGLIFYIKNFKLKIIVATVLILVLGFVNLQKNPLLASPNNQHSRTQKVARFIIKETDNKPFNFALISKNNYDSAYQFYLDIYGNKPKVLPKEKTDQLFVVCEDEDCKPVGHPKHEIAAFGWTVIEDEKNFEGIKVFKLIHNPSEPQP